MRFTFQESKILEAGDPVDPHGEVRTVKVRTDDEARARRKLPTLDNGRKWVRIDPQEAGA